MKKNIKLLTIILICILSLTFAFACAPNVGGDNNGNLGTDNGDNGNGNGNGNTDNGSGDDNAPNNISITVKVVDIDDEVLFDQSLTCLASDKLLEVVKKQTTVVANTSEYGSYVVSVAGSIIDKNWAVMIYENDTLTSTGIDGLVLDNKDNFEFRVECWNTIESGYGTMDNTDILVDKAIYRFMKTHYVTLINARTTYADSQYWLDFAVWNMQQAGYDTNVFKHIDNESVDASFNIDFSSISKGADWGKCYSAMRLAGKDMTEFTTAYNKHITNTTYGRFDGYSHPFEITFSSSLDKVDKTNIINFVDATSFSRETTWGADGAIWQNTALCAFKTMPQDDIDFFTAVADWKTASSWGSSTSTALPLMLYAATNTNIREVQKNMEKDTLEILFATSYNAQTGYIMLDHSKPITDIGNMSVNQIYACLMMCKAQRDTGKAINLLA